MLLHAMSRCFRHYVHYDYSAAITLRFDFHIAAISLLKRRFDSCAIAFDAADAFDFAIFLRCRHSFS